jgi:preprotein translocase subunit SecA
MKRLFSPILVFDLSGRLLRKASRTIERRHFRQRKSLRYFEKERKKTRRPMGRAPYLDSPS